MDPTPNSRLTSLTYSSYSNNSLQDALIVLDGIYSQNSAPFRRKLRACSRADEISSISLVIHDFAGASLQLHKIGAAIDGLETVSRRMRTQVQAASEELLPILDEANTHALQKQQTLTKETLFNAFCRHFLVTEHEVSILTSSLEPINIEYFSALEKLQEIHRDCELLLAGESQRAGLDIMEQINQYLQEAFQKLYRWILREFKHLSMDSPRVNTLIRHGLLVLSEKPTLFESCLASFSEARQASIHRAFHDALTGSPSGLISGASKPIDLYAHDPLRYIGDLLAWSHSAVVGEREALDVMFAPKVEISPSYQSLVAPRSTTQSFDTQFSQTVQGLVDRNISIICAPLKAKVAQIISIQQSSALCYQIYSLIGFYLVTLRKVTVSESPLLLTIRELETQAFQQFINNVKEHLSTALNDAPPDIDSLAIPEFLQEALAELRQILTALDSALEPHVDKEQHVSSIFAEALDPYLRYCETRAIQMPSHHTDIFLLNCMIASKDAISLFGFTAGKVRLIEEKIAHYRDRLVSYIHNLFTMKTNLKTLLDNFISNDKMAIDPLTGPQLIESVAEMLDRYLPLALIDARSHLQTLGEPAIIEDIIKRSTEAFIKDFSRVTSAIKDGDSPLSYGVVWPRTVDELHILLS